VLLAPPSPFRERAGGTLTGQGLQGCRARTAAVISVTFKYVDGRIFEVTAVDPEIAGAIQYLDLSTGAEGAVDDAN
jgi:hypothetical protein